VHVVGGVLLIQSFMVGQAHRFQFVFREDDFFQYGKGNALRLEKPAGRHTSDTAIVLRSRHTLSVGKVLVLVAFKLISNVRLNPSFGDIIGRSDANVNLNIGSERWDMPAEYCRSIQNCF
jgi:hypothetical protein